MFQTLRKINRNSIIKLKNYSTKPVVREAKPENDKLQEFIRISNIAQRNRQKKPQKPPFVKNLFLGVFDTDILAYPELTNENLALLNETIREIKPLLENPIFNESKYISKEFLQKLASAKCIGLQTSQLMDGRELGVSESSKIMEIIGEKIHLKNNIVHNEYLGVQTLLKCGNDRLKQKYLEKLVHGEFLSAFCVLNTIEGGTSLKKTAILSSDGKTWILNGEKRNVMNGDQADIFIVIAPTSSVNRNNTREDELTAFVVEREAGGISSSAKSSGGANFDVCDVIFDNTPISADNVIGVVGNGEDVLNKIYPEYRLSTGSICSAIMKKLINNARQFFVDKSHIPFPLYETDAIRSKIANWAASLYAIESMTYLTSGLLDGYENQDCELESAIVKVFSSENALISAIECSDQIGVDAIIENHWCLNLQKEALAQVAGNDSNDSLKLVIALYGLKHAGLKINEVVKKLRNPLFHAHFIFKRMWTMRKHTSNDPKLNLYLYHHLHPSFVNASNHLEYSVLRLQYVTELLFTRYGQEIVHQHIELRRLAEVVIDTYAMAATISRASRSYCIGLQHGEYEMVLATTFANAAIGRVKNNIKEITDGCHQTNDENYRMIAKRVFDFKGYFPVDALTRNF